MKYSGKIKYMYIQIVKINVSDTDQGYKLGEPVWLPESCWEWD